MAGPSPQRSIEDARVWIEQLESRLTVAHHRRILKAALSDVWTAMDQIKASTLRRLRKEDRQRATDFRKWWEARLEDLAQTDPGLSWAWKVRNTTQHEGADGAIYDVAIVFDRVEMEKRRLTQMHFELNQDEDGTPTVNGVRVEHTGFHPGVPYFVQRTALGVDMPAQYGPNDVTHPLKDACISVEGILADIDRLWS